MNLDEFEFKSKYEIKWLLSEAQNAIDKLLNKVTLNNFKFNKSICDRFDNIVRTMTKEAETPNECIDLIKYVQNARYVECHQLKVLYCK